MKKFLSLLISASFFAAAPLMALEKPSANESDQFANQDIDEFEVLLEGTNENSQAQEEVPSAIFRRCPPGFRRTPIYRYNYSRRWWVVVDYRCRRFYYPPPSSPPGDSRPPRSPSDPITPVEPIAPQDPFRPRRPKDPRPPRMPQDPIHHHAPLSNN